jgi:hypothetical protein
MRNQQNDENDPRHHTANIKAMLTEVIEHAREDMEKVSEPRAQALFETTAEVLQGLVTAYQHYESNSERAWQTLAVDRSYPSHNE